MKGLILDFVFVFAVGGGLCVIAQLLIDYTKMTPARILVTYVVTGVVLTAIGLYEPLVSLAGCGATTPLTGFGYALARGAESAVRERGLVGALTGGLTGTAGGITAAVTCGFLAALTFRGKPKT
ncbi:MAG: stage V sporulation protein AE [Clostridia bacterium]|nr:stage V sporulation protein AE [Clostridia bacterium]